MFNGILQPLFSFEERFVYERAAIQVKTIKNITTYRRGLRKFLNVGFTGCHEPADHLLEGRPSSLVEAHNFCVKQATVSPECLLWHKQFGKLRRDVILIATA